MDSQTAALSSIGVLIEAVGRGSRIALKRLYELESRRLYGIALRIVRRPEVAADVLQETFVQIWQNATAFSAERGAASSCSTTSRGAASCWHLSAACRIRKSPSKSRRRLAASKAGSGGGCSHCRGVSNNDPENHDDLHALAGEYVLGVLDATRRIPDGAQVAVDGVAGVVRWLA